MDSKIIDKLVCPKCNLKLNHNKNKQLLICNDCNVAYKIESGIPVLLVEEAIKL